MTAAHVEVTPLSDIDIRALETTFDLWRGVRVPSVTKKSKAFERFVSYQVLKDLDPSDDEVSSGDFGGSDDGGIDAGYLLMNGTLLIMDETDPPNQTTNVELILIQATTSRGFTESAVNKFKDFCEDDLLNYAASPDSMTHLNSTVRDFVARFRDKYDLVLSSPHKLKVTFHLAVGGADGIPTLDSKVVKRVDTLKATVKARLSLADVEFNFWDSARLLAVSRSLPRNSEVIEITREFSDNDGSVVCLVRLAKFAEFLTDDLGHLKTAMLEPNVRDYQGVRNRVNIDIRETLTDAAATEEFWWLNNGVTILAEDCHLSGNKLTIVAPEIVNGLQTSHVIFDVFSQNTAQQDSRNILVRIIKSSDDRSRNKVIKATNYQSPVSSVSLHATEPIHFDIEDRLQLYGLYYDRKKGKYRRLNKPIEKIVSVLALAQAVMAILLQRPNDARARPQSVLKDNDAYPLMFGKNYDRDVFAACVTIDRQVAAFLANGRLSTDEQRNIRYYVDAVLARNLTGMDAPDVDSIAAKLPELLTGISERKMKKAAATVRKVYKELGATDKVAKGTQLWARLSPAPKVPPALPQQRTRASSKVKVGDSIDNGVPKA